MPRNVGPSGGGAGSGSDIDSLPGVKELGISESAPFFHRYEVSNDVCASAKCTEQRVFEALTRFPAPGATGEPVSTGSRTYVPLGGPVIHDVDQSRLSVTNITDDDHLFYPGVVFRQVSHDGVDIGVDSTGVGNGPVGYLTVFIGAMIWKVQTWCSIRGHVSDLPDTHSLLEPTIVQASSDNYGYDILP